MTFTNQQASSEDICSPLKEDQLGDVEERVGDMGGQAKRKRVTCL